MLAPLFGARGEKGFPRQLAGAYAQLRLQSNDALGTAAGGPSLPHTDGFVLNLGHHLDSDKDRAGLLHYLLHVGGKLFQVFKAVSRSVAGFLGHAGIVDVLSVGTGCPPVVA